MNLIIHPKKMWIFSTYNTICINDSKVEEITIDDTYKYIGIDIGPIDNRKNRFVEYINTKLINLSKAALKPQQKLDILKVHLIQSLIHLQL